MSGSCTPFRPGHPVPQRRQRGAEAFVPVCGTQCRRPSALWSFPLPDLRFHRTVRDVQVAARRAGDTIVLDGFLAVRRFERDAEGRLGRPRDVDREPETAARLVGRIV